MATHQDTRAEFASRHQADCKQETSNLKGAVMYTRELGSSFKSGVQIGLIFLGVKGAIYGATALGRAIAKLGD